MSAFTGRLGVNTNGSFVDASVSGRGLMTAQDKQRLDDVWARYVAATALATPNTDMRRDANGDTAVRSLTASQDISASQTILANQFTMGLYHNYPAQPGNIVGMIGGGDTRLVGYVPANITVGGATVATTAQNANALGGQGPAYYAPAGAVIANANHANVADSATNATNATNATTAAQANALTPGTAARLKLDRLGAVVEAYLAADYICGTTFASIVQLGFLAAGVWLVEAHAVMGASSASGRVLGLLQNGGGQTLAEDQAHHTGGGALIGLHFSAVMNGGTTVILFVRGNNPPDTIVKASNNESPVAPGRATYIKAVCVG